LYSSLIVRDQVTQSYETSVHNTYRSFTPQNKWVSGLCPSSVFLNTRTIKHEVR
jgi:hypothetical protein